MYYVPDNAVVGSLFDLSRRSVLRDDCKVRVVKASLLVAVNRSFGRYKALT